MSVMVIGDRAVGKTSMIVALTDFRNSQNIKIVSPEYKTFASASGMDIETGMIAPTASTEETIFILDVNLPSGSSRLGIQMAVTDTPGEVWREVWRESFSYEWQEIRQSISQSRGILLLLPPYRSLVQEQLLDSISDRDMYPTATAWKNRFAKWLDFFREECHNVEHILICLNKADVFCDLELESNRWKYKPLGGNTWFEYNNYIYQTYFIVARDMIRQYHSQQIAPSLKFFITTIENRALLEIPWIYLNTYLAHYPSV